MCLCERRYQDASPHFSVHTFPSCQQTMLLPGPLGRPEESKATRLGPTGWKAGAGGNRSAGVNRMSFPNMIQAPRGGRKGDQTRPHSSRQTRLFLACTAQPVLWGPCVGGSEVGRPETTRSGDPASLACKGTCILVPHVSVLCSLCMPAWMHCAFTCVCMGAYVYGGTLGAGKLPTKMSTE